MKAIIKGRRKWVVLAAACLAFFSPSYTQYQLAPLATALMRGIGLDNGQFAAVFSSPMVPAVLFSIAAGLAADRIGIRRVVAAGLCVSLAGTVGRLWAEDFTALYACMLLTGVGAAFLNANAAKLFAGWFGPERVGLASGILMSASTLGMAVGTGTTAMLPGVQFAYVLAAGIAAAGLLGWLLFGRDAHTAPPLSKPGAAGATGNAPGGAAKTGKSARPLLRVLRCRAVWLAGAGMLAVFGCEATLGAFLPAALATLGVDEVAAGLYASLVTVGGFAGCLAGPVLLARCKRPAVALVVALGAGFLCAGGGWLLPGAARAAALLVAGFVCGGMLPVLMAVPVRQKEIGTANAGLAGGIVGTMHLIGGAFVPASVVAPIAGGSYPLVFLLGAAFLLAALGTVAALRDALLPECTPTAPK